MNELETETHWHDKIKKKEIKITDFIESKIAFWTIISSSSEVNHYCFLNNSKFLQEILSSNGFVAFMKHYISCKIIQKKRSSYEKELLNMLKTGSKALNKMKQKKEKKHLTSFHLYISFDNHKTGA